MLSRGGMIISQVLKDKFPLYMQLHSNVWLVRGTLPFPQGIQYIYDMFSGQYVADVHAHPYFIGNDHWPDQPSPSYHLTEEIQNVAKVAKGVTSMNDVSARLDNTMTVIQDPETKKILLYNPVEMDVKTTEAVEKKIFRCHPITDIVVPTRQTWLSLHLWLEKYPDVTIWHAGNVPEQFQHDDRMKPIPKLKSGRNEEDLNKEISFNPDDYEELIFDKRSVHLFRIPGDDLTNEHVMYHPVSKVLSCTDLYHGAYSDFDPVNSWLCRFWFKDQRLGDYKSKIFMPQYRKTSIEKQGTLKLMQESVDKLTRALEIKFLVFSHGTPPMEDQADLFLRLQYALKIAPEFEKLVLQSNSTRGKY